MGMFLLFFSPVLVGQSLVNCARGVCEILEEVDAEVRQRVYVQTDVLHFVKIEAIYKYASSL